MLLMLLWDYKSLTQYERISNPLERPQIGSFSFYSLTP